MWSTNPKHIPRSEAAFSMLICNNNAASFMTEGSTSSTNSSCTWIAITAHLSVSRNTCCTIRIESKEKAHYINKAKRMNFHIFYLVFIILAFSDWCMPEGWKKKFWTMKKKKQFSQVTCNMIRQWPLSIWNFVASELQSGLSTPSTITE